MCQTDSIYPDKESHTLLVTVRANFLIFDVSEPAQSKSVYSVRTTIASSNRDNSCGPAGFGNVVLVVTMPLLGGPKCGDCVPADLVVPLGVIGLASRASFLCKQYVTNNDRVRKTSVDMLRRSSDPTALAKCGRISGVNDSPLRASRSFLITPVSIKLAFGRHT